MKSALQNSLLPFILMAPAILLLIPDIIMILIGSVTNLRLPVQSSFDFIPQAVVTIIFIIGLIGILLYLIQLLRANKNKG